LHHQDNQGIFLSKYPYEIPGIFLTSQFFKHNKYTIMKKVILGAFMLLAVAGTTMAQTAKKDTSGSSMQSGKMSGKKHSKMHSKKHHHKMASKKGASGTATGTSSSTQK